MDVEDYGIKVSDIIAKLITSEDSRLKVEALVEEQIIKSGRDGKYARRLAGKLMNDKINDHLIKLGAYEDIAAQVKTSLGIDSRKLMAMLIVDLYDSIITEWAKVLGINLTTKDSKEDKERHKNSWELLRGIEKSDKRYAKNDEMLKFSSMIKSLEAMYDRNQTNFRNIITHQGLSGPPIDDRDVHILLQNLDLLIHFYKKSWNEVHG